MFPIWNNKPQCCTARADCRPDHDTDTTSQDLPVLRHPDTGRPPATTSSLCMKIPAAISHRHLQLWLESWPLKLSIKPNPVVLASAHKTILASYCIGCQNILSKDTSEMTEEERFFRRLTWLPPRPWQSTMPTFSPALRPNVSRHIPVSLLRICYIHRKHHTLLHSHMPVYQHKNNTVQCLQQYQHSAVINNFKICSIST